MPGTVTRAAVAIGIDNTGGLRPLKAAAKGANEVAEWLEKEGYAVERLTDTGGAPVKLAEVSAAVSKFVRLGTVEQLVIYFAGHGYLNGFAEVWLLSGAPDDANEAVDQQESMELARTSGIPNIIFISDTCRSVPLSLGAGRVRGSGIFPNLPPTDIDPEIDRFYATRPGDPAIELSVDEATQQYKGLFTDVLKDAFLKPDREDLEDGTINGAPVKVVTNRRLKLCLPPRFASTAQAIDRRIRQKPQLRLECGEGIFLVPARPATVAVDIVPRGPMPGLVPPHGTFAGDIVGGAEPSSPVGLEETARTLLAGSGEFKMRGGDATFTYRGGGSATPAADDLVERTRKLANEIQPQRFETQSGIRIIGSSAVAALGIDTHAIILGAPDDGRPGQPPSTLIRVHGRAGEVAFPDGPGNVLVQFAEGTGAIIATIPQYVAQVSCENGMVASIAYVPAENSNLWTDYQYDAGRISELRAAAAASAQMGVFAVDKADAIAFAERTRMGKRLDPTLGVYAALAYAEVGLARQIGSIIKYMRQDISAVLYDIWLLAGATDVQAKVIPSCPMLTQSWSYLRPRGVQLYPVLAEAEREAALWTTFSAKAMETLLSKAKDGALK